MRSGAKTKGGDGLQLSAKKYRIDLIQLLLDKEADIDDIGFEYRTTEAIVDETGSALHYAIDGVSVERGNEALAQERCKCQLKDAKGRTAAEKAWQKGEDNLARILEATSLVTT